MEIGGYSRPDRPWTTKWWNFDLPPGWTDVRTSAIEEVCALQWSSANAHIRKDIESKVIGDFMTVRYESFLEPSSLSRELRRIFDFAGLEVSLAPGGVAPPVMSVTPPAPQKWRKRRDAIAPLVSAGRISGMAREMGYDPKDWENWP